MQYVFGWTEVIPDDLEAGIGQVGTSLNIFNNYVMEKTLQCII
jgi:hypothetical protein